ncbi:hypothetical protein HNR51_004331 [Methylorubrum thiocyanatum]|uniref:Uncharacterized protein n=1 Tax=Methylorubrum thiocyanatum TaxID=47958 RepID=A0AA40S686_9HYPH|nr:hypothetical protein [Methylorubrum thiocyanatum]
MDRQVVHNWSAPRSLPAQVDGRTYERVSRADEKGRTCRSSAGGAKLDPEPGDTCQG